MAGTPERAVDPVRCWVRHVRRTAGVEVGTTIGGATFIREPGDALAGAQGWQSGTITLVLNDNGDAMLRLPNTAGEDGKLHRRRFAILTNGAYRPGEEWIEVYREPHDVIAVWTPVKATVSRSEVVLTGYDVAGHLGRFRGSEIDPWDDGWAPRDIWEHYTRAPGYAVGTDFAGWTAAGGGGWITGGAAGRVGPHGGPRIAATLTQWSYIQYPVGSIPAATPSDCWVADVRGRVVAGSAIGPYLFQFDLGGVVMLVNLDGSGFIYGSNNAGVLFASGPAEANVDFRRVGFVPGAFSLRIIARYERMLAAINGEVVAEWRRRGPFTSLNATNTDFQVYAATVDVDSFHVEVLRPYALRGVDKGSYRLPGIPPGGGLRARYWNAGAISLSSATTLGRLARIWRLSDTPATDRLEPNGPDLPLHLAAEVGMAGPWIGRWTGSIYLDLAASDRRLRLGETLVDHRVFVGKTRRTLDEYIARWGDGVQQAVNLLGASDANFEAATVRWANAHAAFWGGVASTMTRTQDARMEGAWGLRVTTGGGYGVFASLTNIPTWLAGVKYRATVYMRGTVGGEQVTVGMGGTGDAVGGAAVTLPGPTQDPIAVSMEWTPTANRVATDNTYVVAVRAAAGAPIYDIDRVRVIDTRYESFGASLRTHLGSSESGWYPIVIEAANLPNNNLGIGPLEDAAVDATGAIPTIASAAGATAYTQVPVSRLSPVGIYEEILHSEPHRGVLDSLTDAFGYQWRTEPRSLETGEFPGQVIPRVRVGRDTDRVLEDATATDVQVEISADDSVDELLADAAGIADPKGSGQLTAAVIDYPNAIAHLGIAADYESLSDITEAPMLETRLGSLLALRSSPNQQVAARPDGQRDLTDTFPLTGSLARLRWLPGDGIRLALRDLDVIDRTPRQMIRVALAVAPDAIASPQVGFRQRPRDAAAVLKRTLRAVYARERQYQGTFAMVSTQHYIDSIAAAGATAAYAMLPLPDNIDDVVACYFAISYMNTGVLTLEVDGVVTPIKVNTPGRYDVTTWVKPLVPSFDRRVYARAINASVAITVEWQLQLLIRV
jgi:hypothetical protein